MRPSITEPVSFIKSPNLLLFNGAESCIKGISSRVAAQLCSHQSLVTKGPPRLNHEGLLPWAACGHKSPGSPGQDRGPWWVCFPDREGYPNTNPRRLLWGLNEFIIKLLGEYLFCLHTVNIQYLVVMILAAMMMISVHLPFPSMS